MTTQKHQQFPIIFPHYPSIFSTFPSPSPAIQTILNFSNHFLQSSQCEPPGFPCLLPIRTKPNIYPFKISENSHTTFLLHNPPRILTHLFALFPSNYNSFLSTMQSPLQKTYFLFPLSPPLSFPPPKSSRCGIPLIGQFRSILRFTSQAFFFFSYGVSARGSDVRNFLSHR